MACSRPATKNGCPGTRGVIKWSTALNGVLSFIREKWPSGHCGSENAKKLQKPVCACRHEKWLSGHTGRHEVECPRARGPRTGGPSGKKRKKSQKGTLSGNRLSMFKTARNERPGIVGQTI